MEPALNCLSRRPEAEALIGHTRNTNCKIELIRVGRLAKLLFVFAILCACTLYQKDAMAKDFTFNKVTESGRPVTLFSSTRWNKKCISIENPRIQILQPASSGHIFTQVGWGKIDRVSFGSEKCMGHKIKSTVVVYVPNLGFHGQDQLQIGAIYSTGVSDTYQLYVNVQ